MSDKWKLKDIKFRRRGWLIEDYVMISEPRGEYFFDHEGYIYKPDVKDILADDWFFIEKEKEPEEILQ